MDEMKVCPFCGKEILAVAKMCKYCREWMPEESVNTTKQVETEIFVDAKMANSKESVQDNAQTEETKQTTVLSKKDRDAKIEELKKERTKLVLGRGRAERAGEDVNEINRRIKEIQSELHKLKVEQGLENGDYVHSDDGTIISNKTIDFPYHPYRPFVLIGVAVIAIIIVVVLIMR